MTTMPSLKTAAPYEIPYAAGTDTPVDVGTLSKAQGERLNVLLAELIPAGSVIATARSTAPTGYQLCNGEAISRTTFATLFAAIGTTYGAGNGTTTFNVPDLREKVPVGAGASMVLASTGGEKTHILTEAEMPAHAHIVPDQVVAFRLPATGTSSSLKEPGGATATDVRGGGGAHNNLQPYQVVSYLIKT